MEQNILDTYLWRDYWRVNSKRRTLFFVAVCMTLISFIFYGKFLLSIESRAGVILADPLHFFMGPYNLNLAIFIPTYTVLLLWLYVSALRPLRTSFAILTIFTLFTLRFFAIYLTPLAPPLTTIPLNDPLISLFVGGHNVPQKDLFFSGHTATLFLVAFSADYLNLQRFKWAIFFTATLVGSLLILQHVHFSIDVLIAPFIAYSVFSFWRYLFSTRLMRRL